MLTRTDNPFVRISGNTKWIAVVGHADDFAVYKGPKEYLDQTIISNGDKEHDTVLIEELFPVFQITRYRH